MYLADGARPIESPKLHNALDPSVEVSTEMDVQRPWDRRQHDRAPTTEHDSTGAAHLGEGPLDFSTQVMFLEVETLDLIRRSARG
jgi:hypothetical protein